MALLYLPLGLPYHSTLLWSYRVIWWVDRVKPCLHTAPRSLSVDCLGVETPERLIAVPGWAHQHTIDPSRRPAVTQDRHSFIGPLIIVFLYHG